MQYKKMMSRMLILFIFSVFAGCAYFVIGGALDSKNDKMEAKENVSGK